MSLRCRTLATVAAASVLLTVACATVPSRPATPTGDMSQGMATPAVAPSAQDNIELREAAPEPKPGRGSGIPSSLMPVRLVRALDGDSGIAADDDGEFEFRLYGIDAPERDDVSRDALTRLIAGFGNDLFVEDRDVDMYGRRVVVLRTQDGSRSVNLEMVREGYARAYTVYGELDGVVAAAAEAKADQRGVWAPTPTATPRAGLTARQEEILASVRQGASVTTERLWQLTYEFIDEGRVGSYDDGYAVGYADSSNCDALLLMAQRLMDSSHPALGDNILGIVVRRFLGRSSPPFEEGYLDGYDSGRGCSPWDNVSAHARFSATEEGRLEVHGNALAASDTYNWASDDVQRYQDGLFRPLNAQYVATAILAPGEGGLTFRDFINPSLGGRGLADNAWWKDTFNQILNIYSTPSARLSGSQEAVLDELKLQALNIYTQALEACTPGLRGYIRDHVDRTYSAARDAAPAIGPWEFVSQKGYPCSN